MASRLEFMLKQDDVIFIKGAQDDLKQIQETGLLLFFDDRGQNLHLSAPTIAHFLWSSSGSDTQMRRLGGNAATVQRSTMKSLLLLLLSLLTGKKMIEKPRLFLFLRPVAVLMDSSSQIFRL